MTISISERDALVARIEPHGLAIHAAAQSGDKLCKRIISDLKKFLIKAEQATMGNLNGLMDKYNNGGK